MTTRELKTEAQARGIRWRDVQDALAEVKAAEWARREREVSIRRWAWTTWTRHSPGCWEFWRHGFRRVLGKRGDAHDFTSIPRYDTFARTLAYEFPEFTDDVAGCWEFLLSPYNRLPSVAEMYEAALQLVERSRAELVDCHEPF